MTIDFHYAISCPACRAVMIVAKQLNIELNCINVDLMSGDHKSADFEKVNPMKLVPVIVDDGFILGESRAIMAYLINKYAPGHALYPTDAKRRAEIDRVLYLTAELFNRGKVLARPVFYENKWPLAHEPLQNYLELLKALELLTAGKRFLTGGDMSIADISFICDITLLTEVLGIDISAVAPGIKKWVELMKGSLPEYDEFVGKAVKIFREKLEVKFGHKLE